MGELGGRRAQFFDSQTESMLLEQVSYVVKTIKVRESLCDCASFDQLLGTTMKETKLRVNAAENLPVDLEIKPNDSMSRGMLRAEV